MLPRFLAPARHFHLHALAVLSLLCVCPWLSAQPPSVPKATSAKGKATSAKGADAHYARAGTLATKDQWASAIAEYKLAYTYDKTARPRKAALEVASIGSAYNSLDQYDKALIYYQQALPLLRKSGDKASEATTLSNIGVVYINLDDGDLSCEKALTYYQKALPIQRQLGNRTGEAATLSSIGAAYDSLRQYDKALTYFQQALPIRRQVGDKSGETMTLSGIGSAYDSLSQYDKALIYYQQALPLLKQGGDKSDEAEMLRDCIESLTRC